MSLTREHIQEELSVAYISAVAAKAGYDCQNYGKKDYGIDIQVNPITIGSDNSRYYDGTPLRIQAKATQNFGEGNDEFISFVLKARNYNILARAEKNFPIILVLYCMPNEESDWLDVRDDGITLKHCGYWYSLFGKELTKNTSSVTIKIPRSQIFSESTLNSIMTNIQERGYP